MYVISLIFLLLLPITFFFSENILIRQILFQTFQFELEPITTLSMFYCVICFYDLTAAGLLTVFLQYVNLELL